MPHSPAHITNSFFFFIAQGTYAGQFVMEGFIKINLQSWKRVTLTRAVAMTPTIAVCQFALQAITCYILFISKNVFSFPPQVAVFANKAVFNVLAEALNVLQSIQLPFALLPLLHFTSIEGIMGEFASGKKRRIFGWGLG